MPRGISPSDDRCQMIERQVLDVVDPQYGVEGAAFALVGELDAIDVIGCGARLLGDRENLVCRDVNEFGRWIDEAPDQPRTGDAVDLGMLSGHPLGRRAKISTGWQTALDPSSDATFKKDGRE